MVVGLHDGGQGGGVGSATQSGRERRASAEAVRGLYRVEIWEGSNSGRGVWWPVRSRWVRICGGGGRGVARGGACV